MIAIKTLAGPEVLVDPQSVTRVAGPRPHDAGPHTYLDCAAGTLVTAETPEALLARIAAKPPLSQLTRPDGTPVWIKGSAIGSIRPPVASEAEGAGDVNAILTIDGQHQAVRETVASVRALVEAVGKAG
jgi:hypothetical protein